MGDEQGITVEDLPEIYREGYLHAIESARAEHDPATEWDAFTEYLWSALARVFGLEDGSCSCCTDGSQSTP